MNAVTTSVITSETLPEQQQPCLAATSCSILSSKWTRGLPQVATLTRACEWRKNPSSGEHGYRVYRNGGVNVTESWPESELGLMVGRGVRRAGNPPVGQLCRRPGGAINARVGGGDRGQNRSVDYSARR